MGLAILAFGITLVLGYWGYESVYSSASFTDTAFRSLQLFALEYDGGEYPPLQLEIARFLAPAVFGYVALGAILSLAREQADRAWVQSRARGHSLVVGLGATGSEVAKGLRLKRLAVVGLDSNSSNPRLESLRSIGVRTLIANGTDVDAIRDARVDRAERVIVLTGSDAANLDVLSACRNALGNIETHAPQMHVAIGDLQFWKQLCRAQPAGVPQTEFINIPDRSARILLDRALSGGAEMSSDIVIHGDGALGVRLTAHAIRAAGTGEGKPRIHLWGPGRDRLGSLLLDLEPWCFDCADITSGEMGSSREVSVAFVCDGETAPSTIAAAAALSHALPNASVWAATYREHRADALGTASRVNLVSAKVEALAGELVGHADIEVIARARHADYVRLERLRGGDLAMNSSLAPWDELHEESKASNRQFAESVIATIGKLGAVLVPLDGQTPADDLPVLESDLERLAIEEHQRWMQSRIDRGWSRTDGAKDDDKKLHPLLVPWEELPGPEKEKDRDPFRSLPRILGTAGYEIVMPNQ